MYWVTTAIAMLAIAAPARADMRETETDHNLSAIRDPVRARAGDHAIYLDVLGKAGLWGIGYDWRHRWFAIGAAASYYSFDGDRILTLAPYVAAYPLGSGRHRGFVQLGPTVSRRTTPSPVPQWDGMTTTELDGALSAGYEYRNHILFRAYGMAIKGDHLLPWLGASIGWTL